MKLLDILEKIEKWKYNMKKFMVRSLTNPDKVYTISETSEGELLCTCPAFVYSNTGSCKHLKAYKLDKKEIQNARQEIKLNSGIREL